MELVEHHGGVLENNSILPSQFYVKPEGPHAGERMLWLSVLEDAIRCVQKCPPEADPYGPNRSRARTAGLKAKAWFESDDNSVGSFIWICDALSTENAPFDPSWLRKGIAAGITLQRRSPVNYSHSVSVRSVRKTRVRRQRVSGRCARCSGRSASC